MRTTCEKNGDRPASGTDKRRKGKVQAIPNVIQTPTLTASVEDQGTWGAEGCWRDWTEADEGSDSATANPDGMITIERIW